MTTPGDKIHHKDSGDSGKGQPSRADLEGVQLAWGPSERKEASVSRSTDTRAAEIPNPGASGSAEDIAKYSIQQMRNHEATESQNDHNVSKLMADLAQKDPEKFKKVCEELEKNNPGFPMNIIAPMWNIEKDKDGHIKKVSFGLNELYDESKKK